MKKAIIFVNGNLAHLQDIKASLQETDTVICADGGANHALACGINPEVVIGDLDSISPEVKTILEERATTIISYPKEKDFTDSELAIQYAIDHHAQEIVIVGLLGDRLDHFLANILHIAHLTKTIQNITMIEGKQTISVIHKTKKFDGKAGDTLSLIPLGTDCTGITTHHLYYQLNNEHLPFGSTRGISNVFTHAQATVTLKRGILLAIHTREANDL